MKIVESKTLMKKFGIYQIKNLCNNKVYIGSTTRSFNIRLYNHIYDLQNKKHYSSYLQRSWDKYGKENFEFSILEICDNISIILEREQFWLDKIKPYKRDIGYNTLVNAGNSFGFKHSKETLYLIGQLSKQKDNSRACKAMRISNIGRKREIEHSIRMSTIHSIPVVQLDLYGNFIREWDSMTAACNEIGLKGTSNLSKCCKGSCKSFGGFMWVYKKDYNSNFVYTYSPKINGKKIEL